MSLLTFLSSFLQFKISSVLQNIKYKFATVRSLKCWRLVIRSEEGLTLETSALVSVYGGQFILSTQLINQIIM